MIFYKLTNNSDTRLTNIIIKQNNHGQLAKTHIPEINPYETLNVNSHGLMCDTADISRSIFPYRLRSEKLSMFINDLNLKTKRLNHIKALYCLFKIIWAINKYSKSSENLKIMISRETIEGSLQSVLDFIIVKNYDKKYSHTVFEYTLKCRTNGQNLYSIKEYSKYRYKYSYFSDLISKTLIELIQNNSIIFESHNNPSNEEDHFAQSYFNIVLKQGISYSFTDVKNAYKRLAKESRFITLNTSFKDYQSHWNRFECKDIGKVELYPAIRYSKREYFLGKYAYPATIFENEDDYLCIDKNKNVKIQEKMNLIEKERLLFIGNSQFSSNYDFFKKFINQTKEDGDERDFLAIPYEIQLQINRIEIMIINLNTGEFLLSGSRWSWELKTGIIDLESDNLFPLEFSYLKNKRKFKKEFKKKLSVVEY